MTAMAKPRFIVDEAGNKTEVVLPISDYEAMLEALEDARDAQIIDERRHERDETISLDAFKEELKREGRISG
jgi:PHD/YefM family antitoxin component YafN of YafNO toxin-antitoxin module